MRRFLIVTLDTEVDSDPSWRISDPPRFASITKGIPGVLTPLFARYGVAPTYLLSPEVIENEGCVRVLSALGDSAELGTHLHSEFVEPGRTLFPHNMGGRSNGTIQRQLPAEIEARKLETLTKAFKSAFGGRPTSFRSGRYGMSESTLTILAGLGYHVDSSVTPGLAWDYPEGRVDFRSWTPEARWIDTPKGRILEVPLSIRPSGTLSPLVRELPLPARRVAQRLLRGYGDYRWLRPSWTTAAGIVDYARQAPEPLLVVMLHSMEVIVGASPYSRTQADVDRILKTLESLLSFWKSEGHRFCTLSKAAELSPDKPKRAL